MELQVDARNIEIRKSWQQRIEEERQRLGRHHPGLIHHLRVTVTDTRSHRSGGYEVRVVATVPNDTLVVKRRGEAVKALLVDSFDTLGGKLKELQRKRRRVVKGTVDGIRAVAMDGVVKRLFPERSFGFIATPDGREIFFHANSCRNTSFGMMSEGDWVRFAPAAGDSSPTAAWVRASR